MFPFTIEHACVTSSCWFQKSYRSIMTTSLLASLLFLSADVTVFLEKCRYCVIFHFSFCRPNLKDQLWLKFKISYYFPIIFNFFHFWILFWGFLQKIRRILEYWIFHISVFRISIYIPCIFLRNSRFLVYLLQKKRIFGLKLVFFNKGYPHSFEIFMALHFNFCADYIAVKRQHQGVVYGQFVEDNTFPSSESWYFNSSGARPFYLALLRLTLEPTQHLPHKNIFTMGAAASVRAGEEIANSIARIHPTVCEKKRPSFTKFFRHYSRKLALGSIFPNDFCQEAHNRHLPFERLKKRVTSSVSDTVESQRQHVHCYRWLNLPSNASDDMCKCIEFDQRTYP